MTSRSGQACFDAAYPASKRLCGEAGEKGRVMELLGSDRRFLVEKRTDVRVDTPWQLYRVEERQADKLVRTFTSRITQTQAARPTVREDIARGCELYRDRLPCDGEMIVIDLDYVQKL